MIAGLLDRVRLRRRGRRLAREARELTSEVDALLARARAAGEDDTAPGGLAVADTEAGEAWADEWREALPTEHVEVCSCGGPSLGRCPRCRRPSCVACAGSPCLACEGMPSPAEVVP